MEQNKILQIMYCTLMQLCFCSLVILCPALFFSAPYVGDHLNAKSGRFY